MYLFCLRARKVVGVLNVESPRLEAFTERDRILLEILSMHVASAIAKIERESVLEGLVEEKTGDLLAAEEMVTAGKVAAMVAHDLKTPLQTINKRPIPAPGEAGKSQGDDTDHQGLRKTCGRIDRVFQVSNARHTPPDGARRSRWAYKEVR